MASLTAASLGQSAGACSRFTTRAPTGSTPPARRARWRSRRGDRGPGSAGTALQGGESPRGLFAGAHRAHSSQTPESRDRLGDARRGLGVARAHRLDVGAQRRATGHGADERERELALGEVAEQRLARWPRVARVVEHVVDELERDADARAELARAPRPPRRRPADAWPPRGTPTRRATTVLSRTIWK